MQDTLAAGIGFLLAAQAADGSWRDWQLPPGESRTWPTAYVGFRLSGLAGPGAAMVAEPLRRAAEWLRTEEHAAGGWGYAPITGPDADSTALAAAFLYAQRAPSRRAARVLLAHQRADGGFATYTRTWSHGAWTISHPEITAAAILALVGDHWDAADALSRAIAYLRQVRRPDGLWPSYWWTSPLYATEVALAASGSADSACTRQRTARAVREMAAPTCFELALQVLCLVHLGDHEGASACAAALSANQSADGSWPSGPVLRLTHRHVDQPWLAADAGPTFADEGRTFATVTAVAALQAAARASRRPAPD